MKPASFDSVAPYYAALEALAFGDALQRARIALLSEAVSAQRILIAGEGNGRFLAALLAANVHAQITVIDASSRMLALAGARVAAPARVHFVHGDLLSERLPLPPTDLVVTHFFLDCFTEPEQRRVIQRLADSLQPGGRWLWSDFAIPAHGPARIWSRLVVGGLYAFFRMSTRISARRLIDPRPCLLEAGLKCQRSSSLTGGLLTSALFVAASRSPDLACNPHGQCGRSGQ